MSRHNINTFTDNILSRFLKKKIVYDYNYHCAHKVGHALLYYKTDQFIFERRLFKLRTSSKGYTSNWEEVEIARILNRLGFWVDIVDRSVDSGFLPENKYDIFIGNGAGNSGKYYAKFARALTKAIRLFYANGPECELSNCLQKERYRYFNERHPNVSMQYRRMITEIDINASMRYTDTILCFGNEFCMNTYKRFNKPVYQIIPSTSSFIKTNLRSFYSKKKNKFLYFGGAGNLVKGLDLVIESFEKLSDIELYICAPHEHDFIEFYKDAFEKSNIHYLGFVAVGGAVFDRLTSECGYIIFPSSSEGTSTSVVTCMRRGLIPVVTYETGIDLEDFGYLIEDVRVESLREQIKMLTRTSEKEFYERIIKTYIYSQRFTEESYSKNFENCIIKALSSKSNFFV